MTSKLKDTLIHAIENRIPFDIQDSNELDAIHGILNETLKATGYVQAIPDKIQDHATAFHLSADKGLKWGYVKNNQRRIGWIESRESTPIPDRDRVIKNSDHVYTLKENLLSKS